jgi:hypothetical protein
MTSKPVDHSEYFSALAIEKDQTEALKKRLSCTPDSQKKHGL